MAEWIEVTERLLQDEEVQANWQNSEAYRSAFELWASNEYPEEYGND